MNAKKVKFEGVSERVVIAWLSVIADAVQMNTYAHYPIRVFDAFYFNMC